MEIINTLEQIGSMRSRDPVKLKCLQCKSTFTLPKNKFLDCKKRGGLHGSFCSRTCKYLHKDKRQQIRCDGCGAIVIKTQKELRKFKKHFCSSSCSAKYWNAIKWPIENRHISTPFKPAIKVELICSTCSKKFVRNQSSVKPVAHGCRFCSNSCKAIYANKTWNRSPRFGINKSRCETILKSIILKEFPSLIVSENDRTILPDSLEFDLYIPEKRIGIELNGPCHFIPMFGTDELKKTQNKDLKKMQFCQNNNIDFFVINVMGLKNQTETLQKVFENQIKPYLM